MPSKRLLRTSRSGRARKKWDRAGQERRTCAAGVQRPCPGRSSRTRSSSSARRTSRGLRDGSTGIATSSAGASTGSH
eukprot:2261350-Pyramimonas_sp.AAC.1